MTLAAVDPRYAYEPEPVPEPLRVTAYAIPDADPPYDDELPDDHVVTAAYDAGTPPPATDAAPADAPAGPAAAPADAPAGPAAAPAGTAAAPADAPPSPTAAHAGPAAAHAGPAAAHAGPAAPPAAHAAHAGAAVGLAPVSDRPANRAGPADAAVSPGAAPAASGGSTDADGTDSKVPEAWLAADLDVPPGQRPPLPPYPPEPPPDGALRLLPPPEPAEDEEESFDAVRTARPDLEDPLPRAAMLARAVLEAMTGVRPVGQLARYVTPEILLTLQAMVVRRGTRPAPSALRKVLVSEPTPGIAEVTVVVDRGARVEALAMRLEGLDGRWLVTALQRA